MRYPRRLCRELYRLTPDQLSVLFEDGHYRHQQMVDGKPFRDVRSSFMVQLWTGDIGDWLYWGVSQISSDDFTYSNFGNWKYKFQLVFTKTHNIVIDKMWGRRRYKKPLPIVLAFPEQGDRSGGAHANTMIHFPNPIIHQADEYVSKFEAVWMDQNWNKNTQRKMLFERMDTDDIGSQGAMLRYAQKKNDDEWFAL